MNPPEFFFVMTAMIGGFAMAGFFIHKVTELIRLRMERKHGDKSPELDHLMKQNQELVQWRIKAEKRLQVLEEIAAVENDRKLMSEGREPLLGKTVQEEDPSTSKVPNQLRQRS